MPRRVGVVLLQLGGPDSAAAVEPFLYNLFSDPDIIDLPLACIARKPLARLIARARARHVARHYADIGGRSPILDHTLLQAAALERELRRTFDARVVVAMRYWRPFTADAVEALRPWQPSEIVLLPLYPQYSRTTTGSSLHEWDRRFQLSSAWRPRVQVVSDYHAHPDFIDSVVAGVNHSISGFPHPPEQLHFLFTAHSLPLSVIQSGDPYQAHVERTCDLVWARGAWPGHRHLCWQSKVGTATWLGPSLPETIRRLAAEGARHVRVVPISFVSDHVETLYEIGVEGRRLAESLGIPDFHLVPGLNDSPQFIAALARLVRARLSVPAPVPALSATRRYCVCLGLATSAVGWCQSRAKRMRRFDLKIESASENVKVLQIGRGVSGFGSAQPSSDDYKDWVTVKILLSFAPAQEGVKWQITSEACNLSEKGRPESEQHAALAIIDPLWSPEYGRYWEIEPSPLVKEGGRPFCAASVDPASGEPGRVTMMYQSIGLAAPKLSHRVQVTLAFPGDLPRGVDLVLKIDPS